MTLRGKLIATWVTVLMGALIACAGPSSQAPLGALTIDITISHKQVTPSNAVLQAKVKQEIVLHVASDATDELHVHSVPDHKFPVAAEPNQVFRLSVEVPGNVEVELHHLDKTIATIQVEP
jgi:hypothetical protein